MVTTGLKMRNKEKRPHAKDGTKRGQKWPRLAGLEPSELAGLAHSGAQSASIFFSAKYASTLICVLPKPPTRTTYIYPEGAVKEREAEITERKHPVTSFRDPFELDTRERRHQRPHRPSAPLQVGA